MLEASAALTQALLYLGVALSVGGCLASATLRPDPITERELRRLVSRGALITIGATLLGSLLLVLQLGDAFDASAFSAVLMSNVGAAAGLRLSGGLLLLVTPAAHDDAFDRGMHLSAVALVLASFVFSGHAAAHSAGVGAIAATHVAVASWWLAALFAMRGACARSPESAVALVRRFSSIAVLAIGLLVIAGELLVAALIDVWELTPYLRKLIIKLTIVASVLGVATYNRYVLTERVLADDADARHRLRRAIDAEILLIGAVLVATAIMTTYTSPHE
jgi:putative copper export protein